MKVKYEDMDFIFIAGHYDIHLSGLCRYEGKLAEFKTDCDTMICTIKELSFIEKLKWKIRQKKFEWCIGYHWTYPYRKRGVEFGNRKPRWFWYWIFNLYYFKERRNIK